jgi:hypothetical protein
VSITPGIQLDPGTTPPPAGQSSSTSYLQGLSSTLGTPYGGTTGTGLPSQIYLGSRDYTHHVRPWESDDTMSAPTSYTSEQLKLGDYNALLNRFDKLDTPELRRWALLLTLAGYNATGSTNREQVQEAGPTASVPVDKAVEYSKSMSRGEILTAYSNLLNDAAMQFNMGNRLTPNQLLKRAIELRLPVGADWDGKLSSLTENSLSQMMEDAGLSLAGTRTSTERVTDFMDPMDAKALTRATLQRELGRDPTQAEYEDFISAIHAAEAGDPTTQRTTTTTDAQGFTTNQSSVVNQGMTSAGVGQLALERARQNPDWAEWQAMGQYAPALFDALGSTVPGT